MRRLEPQQRRGVLEADKVDLAPEGLLQLGRKRQFAGEVETAVRCNQNPDVDVAVRPQLARGSRSEKDRYLHASLGKQAADGGRIDCAHTVTLPRVEEGLLRWLRDVRPGTDDPLTNLVTPFPADLRFVG